jgi:simple sugar transport system permease protein
LKIDSFFDWLKQGIDIREALQSVITLALALGVGGVIILISGFDPIYAYIKLFQGAFVGLPAITATLARATPIIFTGLALSIGFLVNAANLGAEGQMYLGAFLAFLGGFLFRLPSPLHILLSLSLGIAGGVVWAVIPTILKAKRGVNEIVTTMMMNGIALLLTDYLTLRHFLDPSASVVGATPFIHDSASLIRIIPRTSLSLAFILSILCVVGVYYLLKRTSVGYNIRVVGLNPKAAEYGGISVTKIWALGMLISGGLSGLAGAGITLGTYRRFLIRFSPGYGLPDGIVVSLIGRRNPIGVMLAGIFIAALYTGSINMRLATQIPKELVLVMIGLITVFMAIPEFWRMIKKWWK